MPIVLLKLLPARAQSANWSKQRLQIGIASLEGIQWWPPEWERGSHYLGATARPDHARPRMNCFLVGRSCVSSSLLQTTRGVGNDQSKSPLQRKFLQHTHNH